MNSVEIDHIDPRKGKLVCGLHVLSNLRVQPNDKNNRKNNYFVPYRIDVFPAPAHDGDMCEFLVNGEWLVCEFLGETWKTESKKIGGGSEDGGKTCGRTHYENKTGWFNPEVRERARRNSMRRVTAVKDGRHVQFPSIKEASAFLQVSRRTIQNCLAGTPTRIEVYYSEDG